MTISELSAGQGNVNVEGTITEVGEIRTFNKFGRELKVANAILKDDSGTIKLTLWNDEANKFSEGDKVKIENGYVNEFQGDPQLTAGKFGKIEKVDGAQEELPSENDSGDADTKVDESAVAEAEESPSEVPVEETAEAGKGAEETQEDF